MKSKRKKGSKNKKTQGEKDFEVLNAFVKANDINLADRVVKNGLVKFNNIRITLKCLGRVYNAEGETFEEAIKKIKISGGAKALSVITVTKDGKTITKILNARQTNGVFGQW